MPEPVVERSHEVLERLREEKAIEAKGGGSDPVQAVFDISAGEFRSDAAADGGGETDEPETGEVGVTTAFGEDAPEVLEALADLDVNETPPVELMARVQELQEQLDAE